MSVVSSHFSNHISVNCCRIPREDWGTLGNIREPPPLGNPPLNNPIKLSPLSLPQISVLCKKAPHLRWSLRCLRRFFWGKREVWQWIFWGYNSITCLELEYKTNIIYVYVQICIQICKCKYIYIHKFIYIYILNIPLHPYIVELMTMDFLNIYRWWNDYPVMYHISDQPLGYRTHNIVGDP